MPTKASAWSFLEVHGDDKGLFVVTTASHSHQAASAHYSSHSFLLLDTWSRQVIKTLLDHAKLIPGFSSIRIEIPSGSFHLQVTIFYHTYSDFIQVSVVGRYHRKTEKFQMFFRSSQYWGTYGLINISISNGNMWAMPTFFKPFVP